MGEGCRTEEHDFFVVAIFRNVRVRGAQSPVVLENAGGSMRECAKINHRAFHFGHRCGPTDQKDRVS